MRSLIYGIQNNTNQLIYKKKQTDRHRKQTYDYQREKERERDKSGV